MTDARREFHAHERQTHEHEAREVPSHDMPEVIARVQRTPPDLTLRLLSKTVYLCSVRALLESLAIRLGFAPACVGHIVLAVDEALANVIRHGYHSREDGTILLTIHLLRDEGGTIEGLGVTIEDEGEQIDPTSVRGRDLDDVRPGGLGVHIIRQVMDASWYERVEGKQGRGMRLSLAKLVCSKAPACVDQGACECDARSIPPPEHRKA